MQRARLGLVGGSAEDEAPACAGSVRDADLEGEGSVAVLREEELEHKDRLHQAETLLA
eukprot:CAMPEP_0180534340 /NCGR_PEP_ID=MMETSP1036_2-20121128/64119_1 /TAXON_ID=632150 /ORGANISM="Azadinium spinosum, Strain 3D9" /LENGTH=57 /DNA_ID=CAMNT_0022548639 /DNA_START=71 /DNA_END=240 /DNA_ORIENTATION=-